LSHLNSLNSFHATDNVGGKHIMRIIGIIIGLVILANVIVWVTLPDTIANIILIGITIFGALAALGIWRWRGRS